MGNGLHKSRTENNKHTLNIQKRFSENRTVYDKMSKNVVETEGVTNDVTIWRIRVACWISKAT